jgi:diacylglycerol kinase (ATP)
MVYKIHSHPTTNRQVHMGEAKESVLRHIGNAAIWSAAGVKTAWKNELAFRIEAIIITIMMPAGIWLGRSAAERALLIASCLLILVTELLNSALEAVVDRIGTERHELSGRAKDMGSAAAFFSMLTAAIVWALIAYDRFWG